jgi:hypothetical protein
MFFEIAYANSFGSQLRALRLLSDTPNGVLLESLEQFYNEGVAQLPIAYSNRTFNDWVSYLTMYQLALQEGTTIKMGPLGKELLKYIVDQNYSIQVRLG